MADAVAHKANIMRIDIDAVRYIFKLLHAAFTELHNLGIPKICFPKRHLRNIFWYNINHIFLI